MFKSRYTNELYCLSTIFALFFFNIFALLSQLTSYGQACKLSLSSAYQLTANFNALIFILPILGAFLSSKLDKSLLIIASCLTTSLGFASLFFLQANFLFLGVALIETGYALFFPAISKTVADFYNAKYEYTDSTSAQGSGMIIFYLFMNIGAFLGAAAGSIISQSLGYQSLFILTGSLTLLSALIYIGYFRFLVKNLLKLKATQRLTQGIKLIIIIAFSTVLCSFLLKNSEINTSAVSLTAFISIVYILVVAIRSPSQAERKHLMSFATFCIFGISFWSFYMLEPSFLLTFINNQVDKKLLSFNIPANSFISLNPLFILIFGAIIRIFWQKNTAINLRFTYSIKFFSGISVLGIGYLLLALSNYATDSQSLINPIWVILFYAILAIAELLIGPSGIDLALSSPNPELKPKLISIWQSFIGFSAMLSGHIASFYTSNSIIVAIKHDNYGAYFLEIGVSAIGVALALLISRRYFNLNRNDNSG